VTISFQSLHNRSVNFRSNFGSLELICLLLKEILLLTSVIVHSCSVYVRQFSLRAKSGFPVIIVVPKPFHLLKTNDSTLKL
jgi:hypothetical protein